MGFWQRLLGMGSSASEPPTEAEQFRQALKTLTPGDWSLLPMSEKSAGPYVKYSAIQVLGEGMHADAVISLFVERRQEPGFKLWVGKASELHFGKSRGADKVGTCTLRKWSDGHPQSGNSYREWSEKVAVLRQGRDQFLCVTWTTEIYNSAEY